MSKPPSACHWLQNKAYFFPPPVDAQGRDLSGDEVTLSTPFWCLKTHGAIGPDGDTVCDRSCVRGRECYRPDVEL